MSVSQSSTSPGPSKNLVALTVYHEQACSNDYDSGDAEIPEDKFLPNTTSI